MHPDITRYALFVCFFFFFFSSRRRHTRCSRDWSSDVCSSDVMTRVRGQVGRGALVVSVSKGLEPERLSTPSCVLADVLPKDTPIAVLSGPSFAREVYARQPTAVVAAAREHAVAQRAQQVFSTGFFRVYSATDMLGVELAGALKNV